jgi:HPt (histidine-containing phosphotransfer) domain-containing protein
MKAKRATSNGDGSVQELRQASIDRVHMDALAMVRPGFLTELIDVFLNEASSHLKSLREAVTNNDSVEMRRLSHCLKGSSANMGATLMASLFEKCGRLDSTIDSGHLLAEIEDEFERVRVALMAEQMETEGGSFLSPVSRGNG